MLRLLARAAGRRGSSGGGGPCDVAPVSGAHSPPGLARGVGAALGQDPQSWLPPRKEGLPGAWPDSRVHWGAQQAAAPLGAWGMTPEKPPVGEAAGQAAGAGHHQAPPSDEPQLCRCHRQARMRGHVVLTWALVHDQPQEGGQSLTGALPEPRKGWGGGVPPAAPSGGGRGWTVAALWLWDRPRVRCDPPPALVVPLGPEVPTAALMLVCARVPCRSFKHLTLLCPHGFFFLLSSFLRDLFILESVLSGVGQGSPADSHWAQSSDAAPVWPRDSTACWSRGPSLVGVSIAGQGHPGTAPLGWRAAE